MKYFVLSILMIMISSNLLSQDEKIHWKIILPDDFQKTLIELNKNQDKIESLKVIEKYFKVDYDYYVDTSRVYYDTNGRITKIHFDDNEIYFNRQFINKYGQDFRHSNVLWRIMSYYMEYNAVGLISSLKVYFYDTELGENILDYEYEISYNNDSNIEMVIVNDSISEIGKIELVYKNGKLIKENSYLGKKLIYNIQYHYIVDSRKNDEIVKVTKTNNGKTLSEKLYNSGEEVLRIKIDGSFKVESYKIPLVSKYDFKDRESEYLSLYRKKRILSERYPNPETSVDCYIRRFDNNDNLLSAHEQYFNPYSIYGMGTKWIYNKDGLLKKRVYDKKDGGIEEIIQEYYYKYSKNKPIDKVSFSLVFILKDTISTDTLITTIYTDNNHRNYFLLSDKQIKAIDSLYILDSGYKIERFKIEVPTMSYASNNNLISGSMKKLFLRASRYSLMQIHNLIIVGKNNERIVIPPIMLK